MIKKYIYLFLILIFVLGITGCSSTEPASDKISVVATIFPEYDWAREIIGDSDSIELTLLTDGTTNLHSYQPSASDIVKIADCDIFIYVGGESDKWVQDTLSEATNENMIVLNMLDVLGNNAYEEEIVEGMEAEEEEEDEASESGEEEIEYDEHFWLSLRCAKTCCNAIADALCTANPDNAELYKANLDSYSERLSSLDNRYLDLIGNAPDERVTLLFGDRFPFRYMCEDYDMDYYAPFVGCSAESEASFETIVFLANKANELNVGYIFVLENSDTKIAETIRDNTDSKDQQILVLNSLQSVTKSDISEGVTYIGLMEDNLDVLNQVLQ